MPACVCGGDFESTLGFDSAESLLTAPQNRHKLYASLLFTRSPAAGSASSATCSVPTDGEKHISFCDSLILLGGQECPLKGS